MKKVSILGIGVATMDIYINHERMYPGGNEYNVACNAAILGADAGFLGVFGNDRAGEILEETLEKMSVCLSLCRHEEGASGYSLVELRDDGDREFLDWNRDGVTDRYPVQFTEEELEYIQNYQVVSIGRCSTVTLERIKKMKDYGIDVCYDFHEIYSEKDIRDICPLICYAFFSCSHLPEDEIKRFLKLAVDQGAGIAIGTRGPLSVFAYDGKQYYEQETCPVEHVLDTLGAGDSFIGAFLTYYLQGEALEEEERIQQALKKSVRHSASVIQMEGSIGVGFDVDTKHLENIINR
ncbi:MAG: PfkB family carbohydrate kinase [Muricoprocola sp.]